MGARRHGVAAGTRFPLFRTVDDVTETRTMDAMKRQGRLTANGNETDPCGHSACILGEEF